jgi:hypothetical protein
LILDFIKLMLLNEMKYRGGDSAVRRSYSVTHNRIDNLAPITLSLRLHKRAALYRGIRVGTRIAAGTGMHVECAKRREEREPKEKPIKKFLEDFKLTY